jgi:hypothetical protein
MRLGIMQPYFFPYIGYFQLINAVDRFVFYDDVAFIKQGWINRNRILAMDKDLMITVPLKDQSSFRVIKDTVLSPDVRWKTKLIKTIEQYYRKAPYFQEAFTLIENVFKSDSRTIGQLATFSIKTVCAYLEIKTEFVEDCSRFNNGHLKGQDRVIDICLQEKAAEYLNAVGGAELYSQEEFQKKSIRLYFLKSGKIEYKQFNHAFVPWLSVIDVLMFNSKQTVRPMLAQCEMV